MNGNSFKNIDSLLEELESLPEPKKETAKPSIKDKMRTQGRKGEKLPRINMAFSVENHEYLRIMAKHKGMTMSAFLNDMIQNDMIQNAEEYRRSKGEE